MRGMLVTSATRNADSCDEHSLLDQDCVVNIALHVGFRLL